MIVRLSITNGINWRSRPALGLALLTWVLLMSAGGLLPLQAASAPSTNATVKAAPPGFVGSRSCQECHARFYQLWSTSFHGLAMQPYTTELAKTRLTPQRKEIIAGKYRFQADLQKSRVTER